MYYTSRIYWYPGAGGRERILSLYNYRGVFYSKSQWLQSYHLELESKSDPVAAASEASNRIILEIQQWMKIHPVLPCEHADCTRPSQTVLSAMMPKKYGGEGLFLPYCGAKKCQKNLNRDFVKLVRECSDIPITYTDMCTFCNTTIPTQPPFYCSKCQVAHYCNKSCQQKDWPRHKSLCITQREKAKSNRPQPHPSTGGDALD